MLLDGLYKWMGLLKTGKSQQATDQIWRRVKVKLHWLSNLFNILVNDTFTYFLWIQRDTSAHFVIPVLNVLAIKGSILLFE